MHEHSHHTPAEKEEKLPLTFKAAVWNILFTIFYPILAVFGGVMALLVYLSAGISKVLHFIFSRFRK